MSAARRLGHQPRGSNLSPMSANERGGRSNRCDKELMRPDPLGPSWRYTNHLLAYLLTYSTGHFNQSVIW